MENYRNEIGSNEQEGEIPQHEIDISMANYQVSTEPAPNSLILTSTLPPNEKQLEAKPSIHT
jgi:hypothetical protein